jgi:hypothetical protein
LLQRSLLAVNKERVPATVIEQLTTLATSYRQRNLVLVAELLRVMAILYRTKVRRSPSPCMETLPCGNSSTSIS